MGHSAGDSSCWPRSACTGSIFTSRSAILAGRDQSHVAEAIVVLGAAQYNGRPSKVLKARLDHAFHLYKKGYSRTIITTGSYGPDPNYSEAHVATEYLTEKGVDEADIITEQASAHNARQHPRGVTSREIEVMENRACRQRRISSLSSEGDVRRRGNQGLHVSRTGQPD